MELRSCSSLHFIQAVKGGLVTKVLNVYRGRPPLLFKNVKDLYEVVGTRNCKPFQALRPKLVFVDSPTEHDMEKAESLSTPTGERLIVKSENDISESNSNGIDVKAWELDDFNFGNMTLKQIKERCKSKKRKRSRHVGLSKETIEDDEYDIMEPLSCWKSRILNKKKTKRKCSNKSVSAASQNALSIVKFENNPGDQVISQSDENSLAPIDIKVEVPDFTYSTCKDMITIAMNSSFNCNEPVASSGVVLCDEPEIGNDHNLETRTMMVASEEPDTAKVFDFETGMSVRSGKELTIACGFETHMPAFLGNGPQCCAVHEGSYEYMEHADPKSILDVQTSDGEIMIEGVLEVIRQFSNLSLPEASKKDSIVDQQNPCSEDHSPVMYNEPLSVPYEKSVKTDSNSQMQVLDTMINDSLQQVKPSKRNGSCLPADETKDDTVHVEASVRSSPFRDCSSLCNSDLCASPKGCLVSVPGHSPTAMEKQSPASACIGAARNCSALIHSYTEDPVISAQVEENHHSKLQHPPERLFSTRMVISPTCQKKLREAMESSELDDEQYYKYARKLCYSKKTETKISRPEGVNQMNRAEGIVSSKKAQKPKIVNDGFHHNDILKGLRPSRAPRHFSTRCTSIQSCSESAVLFSQQQMRDIECIATKLAKELLSMKDIVEETIQSKIDPVVSLKYSADELKIAIEKATRAEESARRSLSIMARNCNRFCKIMKLTEKGSAASPNVVCKKRKIVFADEAGGKLCDVKTFENDIVSFTEPKSEKPELFIK